MADPLFLTISHVTQVTMQCAEQLGCEDSIVKFVLPLGVTVNMNGTALYEATTVIFIAQVSFQTLGLGFAAQHITCCAVA